MPRVDAAPEEMRVEELARSAGCSVDTIRFYQKRRLLAPPRREGRVAWYGAEHLHRLARIRELQGEGFPLAVIRRLLDGELDPADLPLAAAVAEAAGGPTDENLLTLDELARRADVPRALLEAVVREGLLVPRADGDEPRFGAGDVETVTAGLRLLEAGFPLTELLVLSRRHHDATRAIAEDAVAMFDTYVREPLRRIDLEERERARRLVDAFATLLPTVTTLVARHFRDVLLEVAQEHLAAVGDPSELAAARVQPEWEPSAS